jgi:hypothetical protein
MQRRWSYTPHYNTPLSSLFKVITPPGATQQATEDAASTVQLPQEPTCAPESDRVKAAAPGVPH